MMDSLAYNWNDLTESLIKPTSDDSMRLKNEAIAGTPGRIKANSDSSDEIKGELRGILFLPIEVLMEILGHLTLPDTLALSRSSKSFRRILMTHTAATRNVWRAAIDNVPGLPSCPKELSEPQYAALIFSQHCTVNAFQLAEIN
ncbi:unnamed protein product [Rhizoctonia solani]|uniref:F-box domain-containing protein n=1 Tax=Rhizoctonia solani TaxID=456999 RepID=A0A8H3C3L7_9AGAM|nr:unnamed protein product [Rhizoctonia solani]